MAGGAATAETRPEADEQSGAGGDGPARRHLWHRQRETDELAEEWRQEEACNEGCTPTLFFGMTDEPVENAADAGDAPGGEHEKRNCKPDQGAADCRREWREIVHSVRDASRRRAIAQ